MSQEFLGGEIAQGLMRADGIVGSFPSFEFTVELGKRERAGGDLMEFLRVGTVGALDLAVEFRRARGQHEQAQAALLTGDFEDGGELAAAIDLQVARSAPRRLREVRMRPTMETDTGQPSRRNNTASLSLPQRRYCSRKRPTRSAVQVGRRRWCGQCERSSSVLRSRGS